MHQAKKLFFIAVIFIASVIMTSCASYTTIRSNPEFESALNKSKRLVILPSLIEIRKVGISSSERNYNYETQVEQILTEEITDTLKLKGYKPYVLTRREIHDANISKYIDLLEESYLPHIQHLYKKELLDEKTAFAIEDCLDAPQFSFFSSADVLVYSEYYHWYRSSQSNALSIAAGVLFDADSKSDNWAERSILRVSLVNSNNYKIIWSNFAKEDISAFDTMLNYFSSNIKIDTDKIKRLSKNLFLKLPNK
ncbi:MAG: hypothetical protein SFT93_04265 [Rickettsiaceae bacterium]|nr:hypothetical protein [Rickettsiaceae bacterium]